MNYKRTIEDSQEYKNLINEIDKNIYDLSVKIYKLKIECNDLWRRLDVIDEDYDILSKRLIELQNTLDSNLTEAQRQDNILNYRIALIVAIGASIMIRLSGEEDLISPEAYNFYANILPLIVGSIGAMGLIAQYINKTPRVDGVVRENEMCKEENKELASDIEETKVGKRINREEYMSVSKKYDAERYKLYNKEKEKDFLINKKKALISLALHYDSIDNYQMVIMSSLNSNRKLEKQFVRVLKTN